MENNVAYPGSQPGFASSLDLFSMPSSDVGIISSDYYTYYPLGDVKTSDTPITFVISPSNSHYIEPRTAVINAVCKICLVDKNEDLKVGDSIACVSNISAAIFENIEVMLNNVPITRNSSMYSLSLIHI